MQSIHEEAASKAGSSPIEPLTEAEFIKDYTHSISLSKKQLLIINLLTGKTWKGESSDQLHGVRYVEGFSGSRKANSILDEYTDICGVDHTGRLSIILVPTYSCNFACSYCYEGRLTNEKAAWQIADIAGIVNVCGALCEREGIPLRRVDFTLLGGEIIQESIFNQISLLVNELRSRGASSFCVITNGYHLQERASSLAEMGVSQVMVTIDGSKSVNDSRRVVKAESDSPYERAIAGSIECMKNGLKVSVRVNVDQHNVFQLPLLVQDFIDKGFFSNPLFSSYLYPISHDTYGGKYASESAIASSLSTVANDHPEITHFRWDLHGLDLIYRLKSNGKFPLKLRYCGATSLQYTVDVKGGLYTCWFGAGDERFSVGSVNPGTGTFAVNESQIERFRSRGPLHMIPCNTCKWALICGGGCTYKAVKKYGEIERPNCSPFPEILELCARHAYEGFYRE